MKQTPEARAEKRYPTEYRTNGFASVTDTHAQERCTYAIAIREEVEPLELKVQEQADELAKLRALVHVLVNAWWTADGGHDMHKAIATAKEAGFTPTTNTEDNG